jgi:hypothetical protein
MKPTINAADELRQLADQLGPPSWARKFCDEWTPAEQGAFKRCTDWAVFSDHFEWMMNEPFHVEMVEEWRVGDHHFTRERMTHGEYVKETVYEGMINMSEQLYGAHCYPGPQRDAYVLEHPCIGTPSERARLGLALPPERSAS